MHIDPVTLGIVIGAVCAAIVWMIGYTFVSKPGTFQGYGDGLALVWRVMLRSALFLVTVVVIVLGAIFTSAGDGSWPLFTSWCATYLGGVVAYFFVRYGIQGKAR